MQATLYELSDELRSVLAAIGDAEDGEVSPDAEARLDAIAGNFADKVDGILRYRVGLVASAEGIDAEIKRLTALRDGYARREAWLKKYVETCMLATGQKKLDTKLFKLWIQANGRPSVTLAAGASIPEAYRRVKVVESLDSDAVLADMKAGKAIPPDVRVVHGSHLRIK